MSQERLRLNISSVDYVADNGYWSIIGDLRYTLCPPDYHSLGGGGGGGGNFNSLHLTLYKPNSCPKSGHFRP